MPIEFDCPACDTLLRTPDRKAGLAVLCPACGERIWVPIVDDALVPIAGESEIQDSWRQELPSERIRNDDRFDDSIRDEEANGSDSGAVCAQCGGPRTHSDLECRYCGAGFLGAFQHTDVVPRDIADIFHRSWELFSRNAGLCIFASLIDLLVTLMGVVVVLTPAIMMLFLAQNNFILGFSGFTILTVLGAILVYASVALGHAQFYFQLATGRRPDVFSILHVTPHLRPMLVATLIYFGGVFVGVVCFIIPGLILAAMWGMYPFVLVHKNTSAAEALKEAWALSSSNLWLVLPIALVSYVVLQLSSAIPGTFLVVIPFTALVQANLYLHLSHRRKSLRP